MTSVVYHTIDITPIAQVTISKDSQREMIDRTIESSLMIHESLVPTLVVKSLSMIETIKVVSIEIKDI